MAKSTYSDSKEQLEKELEIIKSWETEQRDLWFWEKIMRFPFTILDKITPQKVHQYLGKLLDEVGSYIQHGGRYLIQEESILKHFCLEEPLTLEKIRDLPIEKMNQVAKSRMNHHITYATLQGATIGIGGFLTLAIDIPALLGISLKVLQEMALIYGYDPLDKNERVFVVKCLQFSSSDIVGKKSILKDLSLYHQENLEREAISQLQGWREVVATYRDHFGWKKLFQMIPILGIIFGAYINRSSIEEVAEAGLMLYRKRRVLEKLDELKKKTDQT